MLIRTIAIAASLLLLFGCGKTGDTACTAFVPITYSAVSDTAETVTQIRQHNAAWTTLCQ